MALVRELIVFFRLETVCNLKTVRENSTCNLKTLSRAYEANADHSEVCPEARVGKAQINDG
jgi:hypothetical protein